MIRVRLQISSRLLADEILKLLRCDGTLQLLDGEQAAKTETAGDPCLQPDVVIIHLPRIDRSAPRLIEKALKGHAQSVPVIVLTGYADADGAKLVFQKGVAGMVLKHASQAELIPAIRAACAGRRFLCSELRDGLADEYIDRHLPPQTSR